MLKRIDVEKRFRRLDDIPFKQPPDYTNYPSGDVKVGPTTFIKKGDMARIKALISQEGLMKRKVDAKVVAKNNNQIPTGRDKPTQNVGILSLVDKFFNWLNGILGG